MFWNGAYLFECICDLFCVLNAGITDGNMGKW